MSTINKFIGIENRLHGLEGTGNGEFYHLMGPETMLWMMKIWGIDNGNGCTTL